MTLYTTDGKINYTACRAVAERIHTMRMNRARQACRLAGLGDYGCQLHNSLVSLHYGKPWREVDYHYARKAKYLAETSHAANRVLDRLYTRKGPFAFAFNQPS